MEEFDYSPYNCFNETVEYEPQKFRIKHLDNKIPIRVAICNFPYRGIDIPEDLEQLNL